MSSIGLRAFGTALLLNALGPSMALGQDPASQPALLPADQVAAKLAQNSRQREQALRGLEGSRVYRIQYRGLAGDRDAEMKVQMTFQAPASKSFIVVAQEGSKVMIDHVLKKLLQSEQEATAEENRRLTALTPENYEFSLAEYERHPEGDLYVLNVTPRTKNKFLYKGRIWVSAEDFAVTRIEASPAKNPSFWIKQTEISHQYIKVGNFWLPALNRTQSQIRWGGRALLTIEYTNYKINPSPSTTGLDVAQTPGAAAAAAR
jgi:hypothetical protein